MDTRELKLFKHLAMTLHFGKSARSCHVTPSTLTRTIQRLEEEVGEPLFYRDNRSVELTAAGRIFREYADDVLNRWEQMQNQLSCEDELTGELSLYCSVTAAYSILPAILEDFRSAHPRVHIKLATGDAALALERLENREFDMVIAALPDPFPERLISMAIMETPLVCIGPRSFPEIVVFRNKEIDWNRTPQVMAEFGLGRERLDHWLQQRKIVPNIYAEVAGNEAIIAMVSLGFGVGVVPELVLEKSPVRDQVEVLQRPDELAPFVIGICAGRRSMEKPQVNEFWRLTKAARAAL
ncbi:MAG: HTH-type transcriptional activator IlvY [Thermodesulfobacteriota bacterium]